ncbi:reverse transcriptase domain-containing protein [Tanacetum coccineum]|uniref:Reverse transcriptase domain-containing protein n=1 Tax=Tanacetum coccineum TaxID=301880 RepID=A0ABQ4YLJ2_9ASTR
MKSQQSTNAFVKETFMDLKTQLETVAKNHQASIQNLETKFDRLADKQSGRPSGSLPSNTQPNPKGHNSKAYQPPQSRNEHVNAVFTRSGKSYNPPVNPNDQQNDSGNPINFDSDEENEEPTPQPKTQNSKSVKETLLPKPYKPKIPYPQRLRKEKMEAQYGKFLDMIRAVRINVPLIDVLARMPNYGKFLKELISNKHKIEQISATFLSDESSAMIQNKVPPKLGDPRSFLIPCNFNKTFSCNALADLGASINLMPYSLYAKLSLETLKPTKMSIRLADRSFQYPVGIAKNMLVEVGEGHMARQCTQPKRPRNAARFKEKLMLAEAQEEGQLLDEEQLAFLTDLGISEVPVAQQTIPQNSAFQTDDLDAYDSDCDDLSSAKVVRMANLSTCNPEVLSEAPYSNSYPNNMINQDVQEMQYTEQTHIDDFQDNEIHSDSNIIPYSQYLQES